MHVRINFPKSSIKLLSKMKKNVTDRLENQRVEVNFESHPPIEDDLDGITALIRQTFLHFVDCQVLARHLIELRDITQVIALECDDEEEENQSDEDEPDNDIYGVTSLIQLKTKKYDSSLHPETREKLTKFLIERCPRLGQLLEDDDGKLKVAVVVNERYINLPPQLSVPTLKNLTTHLRDFTHLIFVSKVQLKARQTETKLPSKRSKSSDQTNSHQAEPIIYTNPEEEIIFENCDCHSDVDVSAHCDENATWSASSDIKYIPHRRIMLIDFNKWPHIVENLCKELDC